MPAEPDAPAAPAGASPSPEAPRTVLAAARELLGLSLPLIVSSSCTTIQITIDRIFIAGVGTDAMAAVMPAVGYFWTPLALLNFTVLYSTVFVAQYIGAGRPQRVGPVIWQAFYFAVVAGLSFPLLIPVADGIIAWSQHAPEVKHLESIYFRTLTLAVLPGLIVAAVCGFFAGRQRSWTVLLINATGAAVNALCAIPLIRGNSHDPAAAMAGAGYATALGSTASAILGLVLFLRQRYRAEFGTFSGWRFDAKLFGRLMKYGLPNGTQWCIEGMAFTAFILIVGNIGRAELAATTLTFSLNLLTFLPVMGLGQGVEILVGRRQGEQRPDLSARTTHTGALLATLYMGVLAVLYWTCPHLMIAPFAGQFEPAEWAAVGPLIPVLLQYVAVYSLADGANIIYAYALRGAGDTRFVTFIAIGLSWPLMVVPSYLSWIYGWGLTTAWTFATVYVVAVAVAFAVRFLGGKWRTMTVIEPTVAV